MNVPELQTETPEGPLTEDRHAEAWRQYESLKGLYEFYVAQLIDFHRFYFGIAGAILLFVLAQAQRDSILVLALALPLVISGGGVVTFVFGIRKSRELTVAIRRIANNLGMLSAHTEVLEFLCWAFLLVHLLIFGGVMSLLVLFFPSQIALPLAGNTSGA